MEPLLTPLSLLLLLQLKLPTSAIPTQSSQDKKLEAHAEENQLGIQRPCMVVLLKLKVTHGESHLLQERQQQMLVLMLTRHLKLMILLIKHAKLLVTQPGTPTPPPELDLKLPP